MKRIISVNFPPLRRLFGVKDDERRSLFKPILMCKAAVINNRRFLPLLSPQIWAAQLCSRMNQRLFCRAKQMGDLSPRNPSFSFTSSGEIVGQVRREPHLFDGRTHETQGRFHVAAGAHNFPSRVPAHSPLPPTLRLPHFETGTEWHFPAAKFMFSRRIVLRSPLQLSQPLFCFQAAHPTIISVRPRVLGRHRLGAL
jgi:hypothetical protein